MNISKNRNSGNAIVVLVVLIVVAGVIFYLVSDPFSTKVDRATRQATQWTDENIQNDKVGYIEWALSECDKNSKMLEARYIGIASELNKSKRELSLKESEIKAYRELLEECKSIFKKAQELNEWPADLRGYSLTQEELMKKTIDANDKLVHTGTVINALKQLIRKLEQAELSLKSKQNDTDNLKRKLSSDLELARMNESIESLEGIEDSLSAIMDTTAALSVDTKLPSVEELTTVSPEDSMESEFLDILND